MNVINTPYGYIEMPRNPFICKTDMHEQKTNGTSTEVVLTKGGENTTEKTQSWSRRQ